MSASRPPHHATADSTRWLTIAAVIALVYALAVIGVGSIGTALNSSHSPAHWVGRIGSLAVILGVLLHQHASPDASDGDVRVAASAACVTSAWRTRIAPWAIATGLAAIVIGFALGVLGY